jgi:hypothetical protein
MSKEVKGITRIKDAAILKKTLTEMGIVFKEVSSEKIAWGVGYDKCQVNTATGDVRYDEMRNHFLEKLQQNYSKNFIYAEILKKGHKVESVNIVGNDIEVIASY